MLGHTRAARRVVRMETQNLRRRVLAPRLSPEPDAVFAESAIHLQQSLVHLSSNETSMNSAAKEG